MLDHLHGRDGARRHDGNLSGGAECKRLHGDASDFVSGATPTCRAATNQAECTALTGGSALMFDGGACRDRVASDCAAPNGFFVSASKTCRPATQADCDATTATPILDNGACRTRQMNDCPNHAPVLDGGNCRARQLGDTFGAYYEYEKQDVVSGTTLRFINGGFVVNQASPEEAARLALEACQSRFDIAPGSTTIHQCEETVVGGFNDMCIDVATVGSLTGYFGIGATPAAAAADRVAKLPAGTSFGTARTACDCGGTTPIPDGNTCKAAATQAECNAVHAGLVFVSGTGTCRPRTASECTEDNKPILGNDGVCRAATKEECAARPATPVLDVSGGCREAANAGECPSATPLYDDDASGNCRAPNSGDYYGAYYHFTRGGINNGALSFNHTTQEAAKCGGEGGLRESAG